MAEENLGYFKFIELQDITINKKQDSVDLGCTNEENKEQRCVDEGIYSKTWK